MKICLLVCFAFLLFHSVSAQQNEKGAAFVRATGGYTSFGTADMKGHAIGVEYSSFVEKRLSASIEVSSEAALREPDRLSINAGLAFSQVSNLVFSGKINFYPFKNKVLGGFSIGVGPSLAHHSFAQSVDYMYNYGATGIPVSQYYELYTEKGFMAGYQVAINLDHSFSKKFMLGLRASFSDYDNGDINVHAGLRAAWRVDLR